MLLMRYRQNIEKLEEKRNKDRFSGSRVKRFQVPGSRFSG
jgi:hypothetical protein